MEEVRWGGGGGMKKGGGGMMGEGTRKSREEVGAEWRKKYPDLYDVDYVYPEILVIKPCQC